MSLSPFKTLKRKLIAFIMLPLLMLSPFANATENGVCGNPSSPGYRFHCSCTDVEHDSMAGMPVDDSEPGEQCKAICGGILHTQPAWLGCCILESQRCFGWLKL